MTDAAGNTSDDGTLTAFTVSVSGVVISQSVLWMPLLVLGR